MKYLNEASIHEVGIAWSQLLDVIPKATLQIKTNDFSQPVKPYLRYKDLKNRIIAMPAYIGGEFSTAGIKWIASFPNNRNHNLPRAHSTIILNEADTGKPYAILNTAIVSGIRTAAVSGAIIRTYLSNLPVAREGVTFGIIGFGPIGQLHLDMIHAAFGEKIKRVFLFDLAGVDQAHIPTEIKEKVQCCTSWEEVFDKATIFITCTVSDTRYINKRPASPSLHLNVSLRDYAASFLNHVDVMIVDNWKEVCRENTDIENMHKEFGLKEEDVFTVVDAFFDDALKHVSDKVVMFNPMGMAVYDMAIARYFYDQAVGKNIGVDL